MFWALSCIWWNVFLANYLLAICGPWHTTLLWFVSAELGKSVLQCGLKSAPEKKTLLQEQQREIPNPQSGNERSAGFRMRSLPHVPSFTQLLVCGWVRPKTGLMFERRNVSVGSGRIWQELFSPSGHRCQEAESWCSLKLWPLSLCLFKCLQICFLLKFVGVKTSKF